MHQNSHFHFNVLPFGLSVSPSAYGKMMKELLKGTKNTDNFVDDIICYNSSINDHLKTMEELFTRLRAANVKIRPTKVKLGYPNVEYVGMVVGDGQLKPTDESISKVMNAQRPTTKKGIRNLVGLINWLRKFLPNAAHLVKPFNDLLTKDKSNIVAWTPKIGRAHV